NKIYEKQFVHRNSLLTDLFENIHVRTVYHLFITILIGLFVNTAVYDYLKYGKVVLGLKLIKLSFVKLHIALLAWFGYFTCACLAYFSFKLWANYRIFLPKLKQVHIWDLLWLVILVGYYVCSFQTAGYVVTVFELPPASSAIVVFEQTRFLMKIHSFVRSNCPKVLHHKPHDDNKLILPEFSHFLYFIFVPTLIYRDAYPKTKKINWNFVCCCFFETVAVVFFFSFVIDRFLNPSVQDFGIRKYTVNEIILCIFENTITGVLILLSNFFLLLHSWQNLFAELTRFGDRMFYRDWWTCTDFSGYFRKWNIIVQDWLYIYIYKDFHETVFHNNAILAKFAVFGISAVVHEWIVTYMLGFFFPLLFIEFLFLGSLFNFLGGAPKTAVFNILFWYALSFGAGSLATMYAFEFYARMNAPIENPTLKDILIPRFLTCECIDYS
ncbi:sterol O-acyltransferase 1, partial [Asbolus verrucosus]